MAKHIIHINDVKICELYQGVASSSATQKRLIVVTKLSRVAGGSTVTFQVEHHNEKVYEGNDLERAVDAYNKI